MVEDWQNTRFFIHREVIYIPAAQTNDGEISVFTDFLSVGMVTVIGLHGRLTAIGLFIGYLIRQQRARWADMTPAREIDQYFTRDYLFRNLHHRACMAFSPELTLLRGSRRFTFRRTGKRGTAKNGILQVTT